MTRWGQTDGYGASDHLHEVNKYLGKDRVDYVLINKNGEIPKEIIKRYEEERAFPVKDDLKGISPKVIRGKFISSDVYKKPKSDKLKRSLIRHDPDKLAAAVVKLLN